MQHWSATSRPRRRPEHIGGSPAGPSENPQSRKNPRHLPVIRHQIPLPLHLRRLRHPQSPRQFRRQHLRLLLRITLIQRALMPPL